MTTFYEKALEIINDFSEIACNLQSYDDYQNRNGYIYFDTENDAFEIELEAIRVDGYSLQRHLEKGGERLTAEQVAELVLEQNPYNGVPQKYTSDDVAELIKRIRTNYFFQYHTILGIKADTKAQLEAINKEAGKQIVNVEIVEALTAGLEEFYESSRCW